MLPHPQADADGEKGPLNYPQRMFERPLSQPHPLADAETLSCKLAKASLLGERQSEGVFCRSNEADSVSSGTLGGGLRPVKRTALAVCEIIGAERNNAPVWGNNVDMALA